jgi:type I restriction enzyme S subunit
MIEGLQPYSELRPADIDWLDLLPAHWQQLPLKRIASSDNSGCYGRDPDVRGTVLPVATTAQIDREGNFSVEKMPLRSFQSDEVKRYGCTSGDVLVVKSSGSAANVISGKAGIVGATTPTFVFSNFLMRFRARESHVLSQFLFLLLTCNLTRQRVIRMVSTTTYPNLRVQEYCSALLPVPPPDEQAAIVRFLDHANRKIDGFIRAKRKLIGLLNEQKQAIIHRAVTRGLNPNAPLKPSGIPWLGDIPQHWEQHALCRLSKLRVERNPGGLPLLSVFLDRGVIRYEEGGGQVHAPSLDLSNYQVVRVGDFVLNNQQAWRGSVGVSAHEGIISPAYIVLEMSPQLDPTFANYLMRSRAMVDQFVAASKGVGDIQRQVFWPFLRIVQVPVPPLEEQKTIVDFLARDTKALSHAIARTEREIALMQEYRTRLTADVVTGKLDVRAAAEMLPDLTDQPQTELDESSANVEVEEEEEV